MENSPGEVTQLLNEVRRGNRDAEERLVSLVYEELRRLARRYMQRETAGHTLRTTALVHEAYIELVGQRRVQWQNRAHFFGVASRLMRRILVEHARTKSAGKRGGGEPMMPLNEALTYCQEWPDQFLVLDEALEHLSQRDPQQGRIVELRVFAGLSVEETAGALGISKRTVERDWKVAKAWLHGELVKRT